jgi:GT2 family glycosyltransferase
VIGVEALTRRTVTRSPAPLAAVPATGAPTVSFITVAYGTGPLLVESIASLVASLDDTSVEYEYLVVDNAHPTAGHRVRHELLLSTAGVTIVSPGTNLGFGGGCELGALHARGDVLAFVNPDLIFVRGWLEPLLAALADHPIVVPVLLDPDGTVQEAGQVLRSDGSTRALTEPPDVPGRGQAHYASAACWLMRRDAHERCGGFDPAFHPAYYEDVDLMLRASRLGLHWALVPASRIVHHRGAGTADRGVPDTRRQRATLLAHHPEIAWSHPSA